MARSHQPRLSLARFEGAVLGSRFGTRALRMARAILIDGMGPSAAGRLCGRSHEAARRAARRVWERSRCQGMPAGWTSVTVVVPAEVAEEIREVERGEQRQLQYALNRPW